MRSKLLILDISSLLKHLTLFIGQRCIFGKPFCTHYPVLMFLFYKFSVYATYVISLCKSKLHIDPAAFMCIWYYSPLTWFFWFPEN